MGGGGRERKKERKDRQTNKYSSYQKIFQFPELGPSDEQKHFGPPESGANPDQLNLKNFELKKFTIYKLFFTS